MATSALVEKDIEEGTRLLTELDRAGVPVDAAFWYYRQEPDRWNLIIESELVSREGPIKAYGKLGDVVRRLRSRGIEFDSSRVELVKKNDTLPRLLRKAVRRGPDLSGMWFKGNTINGVYIDDAYIYRTVH